MTTQTENKDCNISEPQSMRFWQFMKWLGITLLRSFGWWFTIIGPYIVWSGSALIGSLFHWDRTASSWCGIIFVQILLSYIYLYNNIEEIKTGTYNKANTEVKEIKRIHNDKLEGIRKDYQMKEVQLSKRQSELESIAKYREMALYKEYREKEIDLIRRENRIHTLLGSTTPFKELAKMFSEVEEVVFHESMTYLKTKRNPAHTAAEEIKRMKVEFKKFREESRTMEFKYNFILNRFPGLKEIVESEDDLIEAAEYVSDPDVLSDYDRRQDYLSKEEYASLSDIEKSQRALDNYIKGRKRSKWQIGRDYEMSCAWQLRQEGYVVDLHGIKHGKGDLGRDLIAIKQIGGMFGEEVLLIQCKKWRTSKPIRENVIMQLFGSACEFEWEYNHNNVGEVIPVLMIPPSSVISETAMMFVKKLKIRIMYMEDKDFPRIKCNINHGVKIYHLPFDQLYDRTEIKLKGEHYAWTVKEAEKLGFTRAKRHFFS